MKKGTILITLGLLLITAAFCLVGYNLYESYRAGKASDSIMEELEEAINEAANDSAAGDGNDSEGNAAGGETGTGTAATSASGAGSGTAGGAGISGNGQGSISENAANHAGTEGMQEETLGDLYPNRDMPALPVNSIDYIGWIFIPTLSLRLPVQGEWVYDLLTISPARYSGSVYQDNMIIGGHSYITHFRGLRNIAPGARVTFFDTEGFSYEYEVEYVMNLNPNQGVVLSDEKNEDWDLTLFTCNTGGQTRCVVRCVKLGE